MQSSPSSSENHLIKCTFWTLEPFVVSVACCVASGDQVSCMGCGHSCTRRELPAHLLKRKTCRTAEGNAVLGKSKRVRARRTIDFKCNILSELMALESRGIPAAATLLVSMRPGLSKQILSGWKSTSAALFSAQSLGQGHSRILQNTSRIWYSKEEDELYVRFIFGREVKSFKLDDT